MTHLFGDRQDFAIEAGLNKSEFLSRIVYGHMCVWCRGVPLGDIEEPHCMIGGAGGHFRRLVDPVDGKLPVDGLWVEEFEGLDDVAVWNFLDGLLWEWHGDDPAEPCSTRNAIRTNGRHWWDFNFLSNWGEQFDGFKSFLLRPPGDSVRILSRRLPKRMGLAVDVSRDTFVGAVTRFCDWMDEQERLSALAVVEAARSRRHVAADGPPWFPAEALVCLQSARFQRDAFPCLDVGSESLFWSDEAFMEFAAVCQSHGCEWFLDPLIHRSSIICGQPDEASRQAWEELLRLCPGWPGFRPERRSESLGEELNRQISRLRSA
jgi:hypothetical protein